LAVQMLDHRDIEEIVRSSLDPASGLVVVPSADAHHYLTMTIQASRSPCTPPRLERAEARIGTNGVDTFVLDLDGSFEYRDIDWQPQGQREILTLMTRLAQAYLAGGGSPGEKRGVTGRRYGQLTLELDGKPFVFKGERREPT
jgi:hypothetical protein